MCLNGHVCCEGTPTVVSAAPEYRALFGLGTGGALALQIFAGGARFNAEAVVPQIVAIGMVRELGPVLVGLMIAARVTSSIAAEIATMKVTEQIDALTTLSTNPMKYLVAPRLLAAVIVMPDITRSTSPFSSAGIRSANGISTICSSTRPRWNRGTSKAACWPRSHAGCCGRKR